MQTRFQVFDLFKGLAVLFMIQVHIVELFATQTFFESTIGKLLLFFGGPPCAPVFLFVFGYFIASGSKATNYYLKRALILLLIGLILNVSLNFNLIYKVFKGSFELNILPYIFGVDILMNAGLSLFLLTLIKFIFKDKLVAIAFLIIISAYLGLALIDYKPEDGFSKYIFSYFFKVSWWSYFPVFPWFAYTLSGYFFYYFQRKANLGIFKSVKVQIFIYCCFAVFLIFTFKFALNISSNLTLYYRHGLIFFLWVALFIAFYGFVVNNSERFFGNTYVFRYIKWLGKNVTVVYIIQWIIIGNISTEIYRTVNSNYYLLLSFILIILATSGLTYFYIKIREIRL